MVRPECPEGPLVLSSSVIIFSRKIKFAMGGGSGCVFVLVVFVHTCGMVQSGAVPSERTANVITSCAPVKPILEMKNLSTVIPDQPVNGKCTQRHFKISVLRARGLCSLLS